ncbi:FixH family protein [Aurantivibrio plasticivorans]
MTEHLVDPSTIPAYKQKWFWFIMSPLILVIIACCITVTIAVSNRDDVVIGDYYKEGLLLNEKKSQQELAAKLGLRGQLTFDAELAEVVLRLQATSASEPLPSSMTLKMSHPAFSDRDATITMKKIAGADSLSFIYSAEYLGEWNNRWYWHLEPAAQATGGWQLKGEIDFSQSNSVDIQG